ncbi:hypothetical protein [Pseudomonas orientalis]|uniref:Uncharacterized protein n=1 Tax=Pseudomonas orientalis TaxID=76758 RepID=A0A8B3XSN3_9PSED|nr:hypothetical protein [Pseudomonas orientalis]SDT90693.1 hypothetical protein SAMN04490197_0721 [Pseudomonas orientalis]
MTLQTLVLPDVRSLAAALRARLCRAPAGVSPARAAFVSTCLQMRPARPLAHWRVCPRSGQLVQHWDHADPQDPQRPIVSSLAQAGVMLGFYLSARTA